MRKKSDTTTAKQQAEQVTDAFLPSLKDVLSLPVLQGCRLLGGNRILSQIVRGVNIAEVPDYENWINEGEILVSTCYALYRNEAEIKRFIPTLVKHGIVAALIKPSRFLGEMPETMIKSANKHHFALIELPEHIRFADITKAVSDEIMRRQHDLLRKCLSVNDILARTITAGADLNEIASVISEMTGCSVWITDNINNRNAIHLIDAHKSVFIKKDGTLMHKKMEKASQIIDIRFEQELFGKLLLCAAENEEANPGKELTDQIIRAIPLEISRYRALREHDERNFSEFFLHLVSDKIMDETAEMKRANEYAFSIDMHHLLLDCKVQDLKRTAESVSVFRRDALHHALRRAFLDTGISFRTMDVGDGFRVLFTLSEEEANRSRELEKKVKSKAGHLFHTHRELCISFGCSRVHKGLSGLRACATEALQALRSAMEHESSSFIAFDDLGFIRLLYASRPYEEALSYINETLRGLTNSVNEKDQSLLETLDMFFECQGNHRKMAERLFLHYNTVAYRLHRIQMITGLDLTDRQDRQRAELALQLYRAL